MTGIRFWSLPVLWGALIFVLSSRAFHDKIPTPGFLQQYQLDKPAHAIVFGLLAWLLIRALRRAHNLRLPAALTLAILLTSVYGASDEWHQSFVPGRFPTAWDWLADTAGAVLAAWLYVAYERRRVTAEGKS